MMSGACFLDGAVERKLNISTYAFVISPNFFALLRLCVALCVAALVNSACLPALNSQGGRIGQWWRFPLPPPIPVNRALWR
jgi:hypothetical protein